MELTVAESINSELYALQGFASCTYAASTTKSQHGCNGQGRNRLKLRLSLSLHMQTPMTMTRRAARGCNTIAHEGTVVLRTALLHVLRLGTWGTHGLVVVCCREDSSRNLSSKVSRAANVASQVLPVLLVVLHCNDDGWSQSMPLLLNHFNVPIVTPHC
jgi:hypothetical protein